MSDPISFGATITGGIQNIAGLLPLLGTQQCEEHIGSALSKGYLYAAATPLSIFGSLGVARAGFKTLIACMPGRTWSGATGARVLANMGFEPKGTNLSLVMIDKDDKARRHLAETRLDELVKELNLDKSRIAVSHKCARWNFTMILVTAFLSSLGMIPYIHINLGGSKLTHFSQWTFPILRSVGGFLTASIMQILLQRRIGRLAARHLAKSNQTETLGRAGESPGQIPGNASNVERPPTVDVARGSQGDAHSDPGARRGGHNSGIGDVESGLSVPNAPQPASDSTPTEGQLGNSNSSQHDTASGLTDTVDWVFLILLLAGVLSIVVGYVGCFSVVQNAKSRTGPLSWLCLEAGLSMIRMILWGLNPEGDDAPPLELNLRLDHSTILPTCNAGDSLIHLQKTLPLTRSSQFLNMVTSFAGLIERFTHPDLTLYYTLTRKRIISPEASDQASRRVLYITIFDHKERTTRVYTRDGTTDCFYSTESNVPIIDLRHGLLETNLDKEIISKDDPIAGDTEIHSLLRKHYESIMDQIHFTSGDTHNTTATPAYTIENKWTMRAADTMGARERRRREEMVQPVFGRTWALTVERGRLMETEETQPTSERDRVYLEHGWIESDRRTFDLTRGRWIDMYMDLVIAQTRDEDELTAALGRVDGEPAANERAFVGKKAFGSDALTLAGLDHERFLMEMLLVYEVEVWEEQLVWNRVKEFMDRDDVPKSETERLTREWRGNCWKRLNTNLRAMDARMERAKAALPNNDRDLQREFNILHSVIRKAWQDVFERLDHDTLTPSASSTLWTRFNDNVRRKSSARLLAPRELDEQARRQHDEMAHRLKKELEDVEYRISHGLDHRDQFVHDEDLLRCRHSRSKSLSLSHLVFPKPSLDFYSRALVCNNDVIHIVFRGFKNYAWIAETIRNMPSVTSIQVDNTRLLPSIPRDTPLFIGDYDDDEASESLETFLKSDDSLARSHNTYVFIKSGRVWTIAVSFVGPSSGDLILRPKHRTAGPDATLTVLGTSFTLAITKSLTIDDINLHSDDNSSSQPSFKRDARNNLILRIPQIKYTLHDIQLLDEDGYPYGQPNITASDSSLFAS